MAGHAVVREPQKSDTFDAWPQPEGGKGVMGEGWVGRAQVFAASWVPSHLLEPGRHQAAKKISKRSPFSFSYELFSL